MRTAIGGVPSARRSQLVVAALLLIVATLFAQPSQAQNALQVCDDSGAAARAPFGVGQCATFAPAAPADGEVVLTASAPTYNWSATNWAVEDTLPATAYIWATDAGWVLKSQVAFPAGASPPASPSSGTSTGTGTPTGAVVRVNAGGPAYTDSASNVWSADTGFNSGGTVNWGAVPISGTSDPTLYQTEHYGPNLQYTFALPNGTYQVSLLFAENWVDATFPNGGIGFRVFSVQANGVAIVSNLDVFATVGAHAALTKSGTVTVTNGQLVLSSPTAAGWFVDAIAISGSSGASTSSGSSSTTTAPPSSTSSGSSSTPSGVASGSINYPRLSWDYSDLGNAATLARAQHMDVQIIGDSYEGAAADNGFNRGAVVAQMIAGDGAVVPKVQQYVFDSFYMPPGGNGAPTWQAQMNAMSAYWYLWRSDLGPNQHAYSDDPPANTNWMTNPVDLGPAWEDASGNNMEAAFAKYVDGYYHTGSTPDAAPALSGPWHEDIWGSVMGDVYGDYEHLGVTAGDDVNSMAAFRTGQLRFINWYRANEPNQLVMGNINVLTDLSDLPGVPIYQRPPAAFAPLYGALDAAMIESAFGYQSTEYWSGFEQMRTLVQYVAGAVKHPELNQLGHHTIDSNGEEPDLNSSIGQALRYGLCSTLVISNATHTDLDQGPTAWFDYYAVNPATGVALDYATSTSAQIGAARYWLGTPIDGVQTGPTQGKAYARRFRMPNGRTALVLVNPSANGGNYGAAPQNVNLSAAFGGNWTHVTASRGSNIGSNPQVDTGATLSSVTVPVGDGMILIQ